MGNDTFNGTLLLYYNWYPGFWQFTITGYLVIEGIKIQSVPDASFYYIRNIIMGGVTMMGVYYSKRLAPYRELWNIL